MSMTVSMLNPNTDGMPLFARLSRALVDSDETSCGLILAACSIGPVGIGRLQEKLAQFEPDVDARFSYEPGQGMLAILLPDSGLSYTHFVSLAVKQLLQDELSHEGNIVIASFPECGVPKEGDLLAMQELMADDEEYGSSILIYNQPEENRKASTILIIDEDEAGGELLDARLRRMGYEVYMAHNGLDGLRLFEKLSPDLVITELSLPVYDGYELIRSIRGHQGKESECSIMVLSGKRMERDVSACFELGVSDYIKKPYSPVEMEARIRRLLQ